MSIIRILHLSDLQAGNMSSWWAPRTSLSTAPTYDSVFHEKLVEVIKNAKKYQSFNVNEEFVINTILITGDIVERGKIDEYDAAWAFLNNLQHNLQKEFCLLPKVFLIPGNHDVDRNADQMKEKESEKERFAAKLSSYNQFVKEIDPSLCMDYDEPFVTQFLNCDDLEIMIVGLNSCMKESYRDEDHYGWIGNIQLKKVLNFSEKMRKNPYILKIAAFHHNPLLINRLSEVKIDELLFSKEEKTKKYAVDLRNYLHDSEKVLKDLIKQGFSIGLHGHQHFDGVLHISFPNKYGEPIVRSNIALLGAGSAGLNNKSNYQPSITSAQLLSFEKIPWGWKIGVNRIVIRVTGLIRPDVRVNLDKTRTFILPFGQPLEPISGINDSLGRLSFFFPTQKTSDVWPNKGKSGVDFDKYILWRANCKKAEDKQFDLNGEDLLNSKALSKDLLNDLRTVCLCGIREWSNQKKVYGNDQMLTLRKLKILCNKPYIEFGVQSFAPTYIINWMLPQVILKDKEGKPISFNKKWLFKDLKSLSVFEFLKKHNYLSNRTETAVLVTVSNDKDKKYLIMKKRSKHTAVSPGKFSIFTTGGCRPITIENCFPHGSQKFNDLNPTDIIGRTALDEMERETGIVLSSDLLRHFRLIALYLNPEYFTTAWLYWLQLKETQFREFFEIHDKEKGIWKKVRRYGRDKWEGWNFYLKDLSNKNEWEIFTPNEKNFDKDKIGAGPSLGLWIWLKYYTDLL